MTDASIPCDMYVDINGLDCAVPFSKLSQALDKLEAGKTLMAVSYKQALQKEIPAFCRQKKLTLVDQGAMDGQLYFLIRKSLSSR